MALMDCCAKEVSASCLSLLLEIPPLESHFLGSAFYKANAPEHLALTLIGQVSPLLLQKKEAKVYLGHTVCQALCMRVMEPSY